MRSPQGPGAGRRSATLLTGLLTVLALAATPTVGAHRVEGEGSAPEPAKIIVITPGEFTGLVGATRTFWASICNEDGSDCKDAKKAKWKVRPKKGFTLSEKQGVLVLGEGKKASEYELTATQGRATGSIEVTINEPPNREPSGPTGDEYRLYISPSEVIREEGQSAALMAWGCLLGPEGRLGANELPDGVDDRCIELDILDLVYDETLPMTVLGPQGSTFFVTIEPFPADIEEDQVFAGVQVVTEFGSTVASIHADRAGVVEGNEISSDVIGDVNGNGMWDEDDWSALWMTMFGGRYEPIFDVDRDGVLDEDDWNALTGDAPGMPTPMPTSVTQASEE
jgi:hypothetical protein